MTTETETGRTGRNDAAEWDAARGTQTPRSEGTAVFVGRASFRMTPVELDRSAAESAEQSVEWFAEQANAQPPSASAEVTEVGGIDAALRLGETVVLSPPVKEEVLDTLRLPRLIVMAANDTDRPPRRTTPVWMIGAALIAGATVTLSAQAVIRRPPDSNGNATSTGVAASRPVSVAASAPVVATDTASAETAESDPTGTAAPVAAALVVPSTATFPIAQLQQQPRAHPSRASGRPHRARFNRGLGKELPARKSLPPVAATWVDPFAGRAGEPPADMSPSAQAPSTRVSKAQGVTPPSTKAKFTKVAPSGGSVQSAKSTWVDPFAD